MSLVHLWWIIPLYLLCGSITSAITMGGNYEFEQDWPFAALFSLLWPVLAVFGIVAGAGYVVHEAIDRLIVEREER